MRGRGPGPRIGLYTYATLSTKNDGGVEVQYVQLPMTMRRHIQSRAKSGDNCITHITRSSTGQKQIATAELRYTG